MHRYNGLSIFSILIASHGLSHSRMTCCSFIQGIPGPGTPLAAHRPGETDTSC